MEKEYKISLMIGQEFYEQLTGYGKELYQKEGNNFQVTFPVVSEKGVTIADCIPIFVESVYLDYNPRYETDNAKVVKSELYKLGKTEDVFNLLISIQYPEIVEEFHEMLVFSKKELSENQFRFELVGDQSMFASTFA